MEMPRQWLAVPVLLALLFHLMGRCAGIGVSVGTGGASIGTALHCRDKFELPFSSCADWRAHHLLCAHVIANAEFSDIGYTNAASLMQMSVAVYRVIPFLPHSTVRTTSQRPRLMISRSVPSV